MKFPKVSSLLVASAFAVLPVLPAAATPYPDRPVRMIVPSAAGGAADFFSRLLMVPLGQALGQPVVIENKAGASGTIGAGLVAKAPPDGLTLLMAQSTSVVIAPHLYKKIAYDSLEDFAPVTLVALVPNILVVNPKTPASTVKELIALAKSKPGSLNYASAGAGAPSHLAGELFNDMAGVKMVHVAYKGAGPAVNALLANEVQMMFAPIVAVMPHVTAGRLKAIALTSAEPSANVPGVPSIAQSGLPGYEMSSWFGLLAPAKTPKEIVEQLQQATARIVQSPEVRERFNREGAEAVGSLPANFKTFIRDEYFRYEKLVKSSGVALE